MFRILIATVISIFASQASAEYHSPPLDICLQYLEFLDRSNPTDLSDCDETTTWVIENRDLSSSEFLTSYLYKVGTRSFVAKNIAAIRSELAGSPMRTLSIADEAGRVAFYVFQSNQDFARAEIYSKTAYALELQSIIAMCGTTPECGYFTDELLATVEALPPMRHPQQRAAPSKILLCLTRLDNFVVPIEHLLLSDRFADCLRS
ncbi:hypothetical protein DS901_03210 [Loktanella sp. D2R18]|uniref:hypothetical protein n=1 Tax=Rhodobacterales TaxID=204455 RepID=UPI000DE828EE|nr:MULTISPECIES: hypothetical protein [Rhodobacterales]MDO6589335.1 hypothetical protein [Yoonia sp. 1_MG-2023]RBW45250.1 hypothetical protein DS901_03210 [Loktanella sp. D2R18]